MGTTEDRLFERWCRQGDAEALGELFDQASPGLLRLAIHLVGEPAEAEDLVQATFLAAIEQRLSVDSMRPVLPWLTAVLSNKAADHKRRAGRSFDVERVLKSVDDEASHPAEVRELSGELAKAIDALEEPYRQVMILRLRHGMSPADIAHVLERSPGAVRVQLHRAQQKLRGRLPSSLVGAFLIAAAAPRGLATIRTEVIAEALSVTPTLSTAATTAAIGGLIMGQKIAVAVVAGLLAAGIWWLTSHGASPQASSPAPDNSTPVSLFGVENTVIPSTADEEQQRVAVRSDPLATEPNQFGSLDIEVVWSDGTPAAGIGLEQLGSASTNGRSTFWTTDPAGRVHIDRILAGARGFLLDRWSRFDPAFHQLDVDVQAGTLNHLRIEVPSGRDVRGRVVDARGNAVAAAELWGSSVASAHFFGMAAQDGTFLVRSLPWPERAEGAFYYIFAKAAQRGMSRSVQLSELKADSQGILDVELKLSPTTAECAGKVVGAQGEPIADADVLVELLADTSVARKRFVERTQPDGSFRFPGLCRSALAITVAAPEYPLWSSQLELDDGESQWLDVQLQQGVTVVGSVRLPDGTPAHARVERARDSSLTYDGLGWKRVRDSDPSPSEFRLEGLPAGPIQLQAQITDGEPIAKASVTLHGNPGELLRWDATLELENGQIVGRVVDEAGRPQIAWDVRTIGGGGGGTPVRTNQDGRFVFKGCPDVDHRVQLYWPGKQASTLVAERDFVRPNGDEVVFVVATGMLPTAALKGVVRDTEGNLVDDLFVYALDERDHNVGRNRPYGPEGRFQIELLAAGRYWIACNSSRLSQERFGPFELAAGAELDVGTLQLSPRGVVELTMRRADGVPLSGAKTRIVNENGRPAFLNNESTEDGVLYRSSALVPGRYTVYPTFANAAGPVSEVWIRAGETTAMTIELDPGAWRVIDFRVPAGSKPPSVLSLVIRDGTEATVLHDECRFFTRDKDGYWIHRFVTSLPIGDYRFEATSAEGLGASGSLAVVAPDVQDGFVAELTQRP